MKAQLPVVTVCHDPKREISSVHVRRGCYEAVKVIPDWACCCGKKHSVESARVIQANDETVRIGTITAGPELICPPLREEWDIKVAAPAMHMDEAEAFLCAASAAMHETLRCCPEHIFDHCLPLMVARQINDEARIATWIVREQTHNFERIIRDNVPIWTRAVFRYTLWQYGGNGKPAILAQREVTIRRLRHYWSMMQNPAQKYVLGDLFVRE